MVYHRDFTKEWNMDQVILAPGTASLLIAHYRRRERELLEAGNRYLERARAAEAALAGGPSPQTHAVVEADVIERVQNCILFSTPAEYAGLADHAAFEAGQDNAIANVVKMLRAALATTEGSTDGK